MRVFTPTGRPEAAFAAATIRPTSSGWRMSAEPAPSRTTFGAGHPALMSMPEKRPVAATFSAAAANSSGFEP